MSPRVAFVPAGHQPILPWHGLGECPDGRWGLLEDEAWLAAEAAGEIELLYLSHPDFLHATRRLDAEQVAAAVLRRRRVFSADLPTQALGEVALGVSRVVAALPGGPASVGIAVDLLTALASFTTVPRLMHTSPLVLVDYLREGDAEIIAELESPSLRAAGGFDPDGAERAARRRFALDLGKIAAQRGQTGKDRFLPFVDLSRTYFVTPADPTAKQRARFQGDPVRDWRDGILLPWPERLAGDVKARGHQMKVIFPATGPFLGALEECTKAQLDIELADRLAAPGYPAYLNQRRLEQVVLRTAAQLIVGADPELGPLLSAQARQEVACLPAWLARDVAGSLAVTDVNAELRAIVATATLLARLCRLHNRPGVADRVEALARALSHVAEEVRN